MMRIRLLNGSLYTLAVVGALAFGVTQAFAASSAQQSARTCTQEDCETFCHGPGGCTEWGQCICF